MGQPAQRQVAVSNSQGVEPAWETAGWIATTINVAEAAILAACQDPAMFWLFVGWTGTQVLWILYAVKIRSKPLLAAQIAFFATDIIGLVKWYT